MSNQVVTTPNRTIRLICMVIATGLVWLVPALLSSTQQWAQLLDSPKHMSWLAAFLYQSPSWILLWVATPFALLAARRWPIEAEPRLKRTAMHLGIALGFGLAFLLVSVPFREMVHPQPVAWKFFGLPYFKSGPQFVLVGVIAYSLLVLIGTLLDTRARLRLLAVEPAAVDPEAVSTKPSPQLVIETRVGQSVISPSQILWVQPDIGGGCVLKTDSGDIRARTSLAEIEHLLAEHSFYRVHRSKLANLTRITEVVGGAHREAEARLDTGDVIPVSRRRREELVALLSG